MFEFFIQPVFLAACMTFSFRILHIFARVQLLLLHVDKKHLKTRPFSLLLVFLPLPLPLEEEEEHCVEMVPPSHRHKLGLTQRPAPHARAQIAVTN